MRTANRTWSHLTASALLTALAALGCKDAANPTSVARARSLTLDQPSLSQVSFTQQACGVIATTLVITENTRLTCDVQCVNASGPCIQFGKNNITLFLAGFTMTGPASPPANCAANPSAANPHDGISTAGFDRVRIRGPGMVQKFRRHGIFVFQTDDGVLEHVTSHHNCFSGIFMNLSNENYINENVSVRNSSASGPSPCGGNCITGSNGNRIRRNHFYGNGSAAAPTLGTDPFVGVANDFGVGLVGTSSNNVIEENSIGGNINGILLYPATTGNLIRHNLIAGNPPIQVEATAGMLVGYDIRDASALGANAFEDNHCITYFVATAPLPCPNFPRARGHF